MRNVFERSANRNNGNNVAYCNASGNLNNNNANNGNFCAPDCVAKAGYNGIPADEAPATRSKEPPSCAIEREQREGCHVSDFRVGGTSGTFTQESAFGYDALMNAAQKCLRGVMWKGTSGYTYIHMAETVSKLCDELANGTYKQRRCREFEITSPKRRAISSISLRDRIVQRSLNDNVIYPIMSRSWIYDNYACQHGKGTDFARRRMKRHLERYVREHDDGWALVVDVHGYYAHMLHSLVSERFASKLPQWAAEFAINALATQYGGDVGYKPGSQMVQIAGIDYLDAIDHRIKERLAIRYYGRYMDDLILVHESKQHLENCLADITARLSELGMEPHPKKTRIQPIFKPLGFLGFDYRVRDGCVYMLPKPEKVKEQRRKLGRMALFVHSGKMPATDYIASLECMCNHLSKGDSPNLAIKQKSYGMKLIGEQT